MTDLSLKIEKILENINQVKCEKKLSYKEKLIEAMPTIQRPPDISGYKSGSSTDIILEKLKNLSIGETSKINVLKENSQSEFSEISDISESEEDQFNINKIQNYSNKYQSKPRQRMYYYNRPTPMDVLIEEQEFLVENSFNGKCIYEWNIDGYSDSQIYKTMQRMLMYSNIAKQNGNTEKTIANMIISGFTGQLKGWWDNYLSETQRNEILNTVKIENNQTTELAVYTLVITIVEHFTGRWSDNSESIRTLLNGMKCKTLTSFRWYKDTFLSRVMDLPESNSAYWKGKFIDGLPYLFSERIKQNLKKDANTINYDEYTYGKLIGICIQEGLALCNEIKLNQ